MSGSALDPDIALQAGRGLSSMPMVNPLEQMQKYQAIQAGQIQLQTAGQQLAARQRAGQIMAAAPDVETGVQALARDPTLAGFAPEIASEGARLALTTAQTAGVKTEQNQSATTAMIQGLTGALENPDQLHVILQRQLATLDPAVRARVAPVAQQLEQSMMSGLPPAAQNGGVDRQNQYHARLVGVLAGAGIGPDKMEEIMGPVGQRIDQGGQTAVQNTTGYGSPQGAGNVTTTAVIPKTTPVVNAPINDPVTGQPKIAPIGNQSPTAPNAATPAGPTQLQSGYLGGLNAQVDAKGADIADRVDQAVQGVTKINSLQDALTRTDLGPGVAVRQGFGTLLSAAKELGFNISQDQIDKISGGDQAALQQFRTQISSQALRQLASDNQGLGRSYLSEVQQALKNLGPDSSPAAILAFTNLAKQGYAKIIAQGQQWPSYRQGLLSQGSAAPDPTFKDKRVSDFETDFNMKFNPKNLPKNTAPDGSGVDLTPMDPARLHQSQPNAQGTNPVGAAPGSDGPKLPGLSAQTQKALEAVDPVRRQQITSIINGPGTRQEKVEKLKSLGLQ